jgi:hypothetical protein
MTLSKRTALGISLGAIVLSWVYTILSHRSSPALPAHFGELVLRIVRSKLIVIAALFVLLRLEGERFDSLGVSRSEWPKHLGVGLAIGLAMFVGLNVALDSLMNALIPRPPASGPSVMAFFKDPMNLLIWLPIGILGGGVVEELQRIFVLTRFEKWLGPRPGSGAELGDVRFRPPLPGARDRDLDGRVGPGLRARFPAPALGSRAHRRARVQRRARHAGGDGAGALAGPRAARAHPVRCRAESGTVRRPWRDRVFD